MFHLKFKQVVHTPTSSAMEFVLATVPPPLTPTPQVVSVDHAPAIASVVSPTPSVMLATLATILATESVSLHLLAALPDNSATTEFVTPAAQKVPAHKETIAKEFVQQAPGPIMEVVIETAQPNTQLMMLVSNHAQEEHLLSTVFAKSEVNHVHLDNSGMPPQAHARAVNTLVANVHSPPLTVLPVPMD